MLAVEQVKGTQRKIQFQKDRLTHWVCTLTQMDLLEDQAYLRATTIILLTIRVNFFLPHIHPVREDMCIGTISSNRGMRSSNLYPGLKLDVKNTRVESLGPEMDNQHLRTHDMQEYQ